MAFTKIVADEQSIYAITSDGLLLWYRDTLRDGSNGANAERGWQGGVAISSGWGGFVDVIAGGDGVLYAVKETGELLWYRDTFRNGANGSDGAQGWAPGSGNAIGSGWNGFRQIVAGGDGVFYTIGYGGELRWYRDTLRDGTNGPNADRGWAPGSGSQIGVGWDGFLQVIGGGGGVLYAIAADGGLLWYRDTLNNGANGPHAETGWAPGSGNRIGIGWQNFPLVFATAASDGILYAINGTSDLLWYRDHLRNGTNGANAEQGWDVRNGSAIGIGWSIARRSTLAAYVTPLSVAPGETIAVKASTRLPSSPATATLMRLREMNDGSVGTPLGNPIPITVVPQPAPAGAWQIGCGWNTTLSLTIDPGWPSGLYGVRIETADGNEAVDAVFVVRPAIPQGRLLLIANTNCWNAYNDWGGMSNYTIYGPVVTLSFERPNPAAAPSALQDGAYQPNHLTAAEIWVSSWLEDEGFDFDTCSDLDFHRGVPDPSAYKGIILSTHPEYWSQAMAQRLAAYVGAGGRLLYWGGNGIFRQVQFSQDGSAMTTGSTQDWYCGNAWAAGPKPRTLLGVAYDIAHDGLYPQRCGYVVDAPSHPLFDGTGLSAGDVIGSSGRNGGGACGWEADTAIDFQEGNGPPPPAIEILAHGELATDQGYTGHMTYYSNDAGGFVFSIGSITFGGSLRVDSQLQAIARNALNACLA